MSFLVLRQERFSLFSQILVEDQTNFLVGANRNEVLFPAFKEQPKTDTLKASVTTVGTEVHPPTVSFSQTFQRFAMFRTEVARARVVNISGLQHRLRCRIPATARNGQGAGDAEGKEHIPHRPSRYFATEGVV